MSSDPRIGSTIGPYRVESLIGRSGLGVVYLAEHTTIGRRVALKSIDPEVSQDSGIRERFLRAGRLTASLNHPNIIPIFDVGQAGSVPYVAMKYVAGPSLTQAIRDEAPLDTQRTLHILRQVASALDELHTNGLLHRDVKPDHILIELSPSRKPSEHVYLTGFGLVKRLDSANRLTAEAQFAGTVAYAVPEMIAGKDLDGRTDEYCLTCVLYECLTGEAPFVDRQEPTALLFAHLASPRPTVTEGRPDLSHQLDVVIATGMAIDRDERYRTCGELMDVTAAAMTL